MKYNLFDISDFVNERVKVSQLNKNIYISTENMLPNKAGIVQSSSLPEIEMTHSFSKNDILVSNIRPYFKKIWYATFDGGCSNDVLVFRAKKNINSKFLYYVLSDDSFFEYATITSKGTKMPRGDKRAIMAYPVPKISINEQIKIAKILGNIDNIIQINKKINDNLAAKLFKFIVLPFPYTRRFLA